MATAAECENLTDLTQLGKLIDTKIDNDLANQLIQVDNLNIFLKCGLFGDEELIPVGSCMDSSKISLPGDSGDVDVLIVSNRIILKESLFDYDKERPAFLHIRVDEDHEKYFKTVKDPINGIYLPTTILTELKEKLFFISKLFLSSKIQEGISNDGQFLNITRTSAVGKEQIKLCPDDKSVLSFTGVTNSMEFMLKRMERFTRCALVGIMNIMCQNEVLVSDDESVTETSARFKRQLIEHENMPLSELLHKFIGITKGSRSNITSDNLEKNRDVKEDGNENAYTSNNPNEEDKSRGSRSFNDFLHSGVKYKRKVSQNCIQLKETKIRNIDKEQKSDYSSGKIKNDATFSIAKSTDYVPAFRFDGWPRVADEWLTRSRKWPSKDTLKNVLKAGCQVVAKRPLVLCNKHIPEEKDPYFRLSFSLSEIILAKSMKEQQLLCWRILKVYQKCYLQTRPKFLTSYHWKNILFWVSESTEEFFWTNEDVSAAVLKCLQFMSECLENRNLPFYFVRKMNMFEGYEVTLFDSLRRKVEEIRCSAVDFLKHAITDPPTSQVYFIDKGEIDVILSEEEKAYTVDKMLEEIVDGFTSNFPSFFNGDNDELYIKQTQETILQMLRKARSDRREMSPDTHHISDKMMSKFEVVVESMKNEDVAEVSRSFDDIIKSSKDIITRTHEKDTVSERAKKERLSNVFDNLRTGMAVLLKKGDGSSTMLSCIHQLSALMQEDLETECDKEGDKNTEGNKKFSTILGGFSKFVKALQESDEQENKNENLPEAFRKIIDEISQKNNTFSEKAKKPERKYEMDLDLD